MNVKSSLSNTTRIVSGILIFSLVHSAGAADIFVATNGSDTNPGTESLPLRTLQRAVSLVDSPGTIVNVKAGNYAGFNYGYDDEPDGTAAAPIVFQGIEPGVVITQENPDTPDGINIENSDYITVQNFTVRNMERAGIRAAVGHHITIRNNLSEGNGVWGILTGHVDDLLIENNTTINSGEQHGIYVSNSPKRPIIRNNLVYGNAGSGIQINADLSNGGDGICRNAVLSGNVIYNNGRLGGAALNMDGVQDSLFENNVLYNNHATGIALFRQDGAVASSNNRVINNTIIQASDGRWALSVSQNAVNTKVYNNILLNNHSFRGAITICSGCKSGFASQGNLLLNKFSVDDGNTVITKTQWTSATGQDGTSVIVAPASYAAQFQNYASNDLRLSEQSLALNIGVNAQAPATDILGLARPQGSVVDAGAYERAQGGGPQPTATPTTTPTPTTTSPPNPTATPVPTSTPTVAPTLPPATPTPNPTITVSAPSNLTARYRDRRSSVLVQWTDNSRNESGFELQLAVGKGSYNKIASLGKDRTSYSLAVTGALRNRKLHFRVRAFALVNGVRVNSAFSNDITASTKRRRARG